MDDSSADTGADGGIDSGATGSTGGGVDDLLAFSCPRCNRDVTARLYGPCEDCRAQLRASLSGAVRSVEAAEYEPKMNVTPNAVATKD